jgi:ubiquinone/menaquinone biosynthesis C-methylase UbiE
MISEEKAQRHEHSGMTSRGDFDPRSVLQMAGVKRGQTIIDAGCGDGHLSMAASEIIGREGFVHALDIHGPSIELLRRSIEEKGYRNICPHMTDMTRGFELPDSSADMVLMSNVLHGLVHNGEDGPVIKEVVRVLRPGGVFVVIEFRKAETGFGPPLSIRIGPDDIAKLLAGKGMGALDTFVISPALYLARSIKKME